MVLLLRKRHLLTVVAAVALCGALLLTAATTVSRCRLRSSNTMDLPPLRESLCVFSSL